MRIHSCTADRERRFTERPNGGVLGGLTVVGEAVVNFMVIRGVIKGGL